jgi:serine/threonine protein kinase/tetratricopeptide (TPR) repeat protein
MLQSFTSTSEREQRLDEVVALYLDTGPAGRQELLAQHADLAAELKELFADEDCFDRLTAALREVLASGAALPAGRRIGPYELLAEIARGGMGVVYRARHTSLQRIVALKMLRAGPIATPADVQRFRREAEAAASLDHPHIVPIFDVGEHEGLPFLTMKLVEGPSLAEVLAELTISAVKDKAELRSLFAEWVRLLALTARAVHYAHQHGILHRDLKPANVLLQIANCNLQNEDLPPDNLQFAICNLQFAIPQITDFGLAKRVTSQSLFTQPGAILGTPAYMAPEQAAGRSEAITTAADVYGLGAILYEMLTGQPPFRGETPLETLQHIQEREPVRPRTLRPEVPQDLETICLRGLEKDPARRYGTAQDLADDLDRFQAGRPIYARPVGAWGRFQRWCRRQPVLAALTGFLILSWVTATVLVTWQWRRAVDKGQEAQTNFQQAEQNFREADRQRQKAERNQLQAEQNFHLAHQAVKDFVTDGTERDLLGVPGSQPVRKKLLERALLYHQKFVELNARDPRLQSELADTYWRIGNLTRAIGSKQKALTAYRKGLEICEAQLQADPGQAALREQRARLYNGLGSLQHDLAHFHQALRTMEKSQKDWERLLRMRPHDPELQNKLAMVLNNLGTISIHVNRPAQALASLQRACTLHDALVKDRPKNASFRIRLANSLENLGLLREMQGQPDEAEKTLQSSWQVREQLVKQYPQKLNVQSQWARTCQVRGERLVQQGRGGEALQCFEEGKAILERLVRNNAQVRQLHAQLSGLCLALGQVQIDMQQGAEALEALGAAVARLTRLVRLHPNVPLYQSLLGRGLFHQARAHALQSHGGRELLCYQEARRVQEKLVQRYSNFADYQGELAITLHSIALILEDQGQARKAAALLDQARAHQRLAVTLVPKGILVPRIQDNYYRFLAEMQRKHGRLAEAAAVTQARFKLANHRPNELYLAARELALLAALVGKDRSRLSAEEEAEKKRYVDLALEALGKTVAAGFKDGRRLQTDPVLEPLRSRTAYWGLVKELAKGPDRAQDQPSFSRDAATERVCQRATASPAAAIPSA